MLSYGGSPILLYPSVYHQATKAATVLSPVDFKLTCLRYGLLLPLISSSSPGIRTRRVSVWQLLRAGGGGIPHPAAIAEECHQGSSTMGKADPSENNESHEVIGCAPAAVSGVDAETKLGPEQGMHRALPKPQEQSHDGFLSSLVSDHVNSPERAVTPTSSLKVTIRRRGKRRSAEGEPSGRMLRLDQSPIAAADAWGRQAETSRGLEIERPGGGEIYRPSAPWREPQSFTSADQWDRKGRNGVGRGLSSQPIPLPLLFVGTGDAFKLEAAHGGH